MRPTLGSERNALLVTVALVVGVNLLLFATPLYRGLVEPESRAGSFDRSLTATDAAATDAARDVLVLGDSRIYNGFDPATAERAAPGLTFINAAVPGTTPRCWDVFDRALDAKATRFRAVVIPVDTYTDDDSAIGSVDGDDRFEDLHYIVFAASLGDVGRVSASFPHDDRRIEALFDLLLRGPLLREDLATLLADPRARFDALAAAPPQPRARGGSLAGLRVDFERERVVPPADFPASQQGELERQVFHTGAASPSYAAYRREWLAPIVRRYRAMGVPVIFVRIPTRPLHRAPPPPPSGTIAGFGRDDGARLLPQGPYVALERPELFADADHLDRLGAMRFSALLGTDVARELRLQASRTVTRPAAHVALGGIGAGIAGDLEIGAPIRFQSFEFAVFFALVTIAYYALRGAAARRTLLLFASWYFYARWNAWYLAVLLGLTATDFTVALGIERANGIRRSAMLAAGVAANVAFLAIVKYGDFVTGSVAHVFGLRDNPWERDILVPVGISFHTFQSISYLVDVARGKVRAVRNVFDYALYIAFFPQLLAGPIVRAGRFFGELARRRAARPEAMARGLHQIVLGLLKKSAIADRFAPVADAYFGSVATHPGAAAAWSGAFAFAMQIYFDFSGYSDIAIGCARVLGFDFPENFHRPYLAWSITEFWRRWHMTLSAWLRDYLYIPLGGNRFGHIATYRNLIVTMLIGGLWHGANWTFVAWGGYHGVALALERAVGIGRDRNAPPPRGLGRIAATAATVLVVLVGWVLFRAQTFAGAFAVLRALGSFAPGPWLLDVSSLLFAAFALGIESVVEWRGWNWAIRSPLARGGVLAGLVLVLELGSYPGAAAEFVYFKF